MKKIIQKALKHPAISGLIAAVLAPTIAGIIGWGWQAFWNLISSIPAWLVSGVTIPIWLLLIIGGISVYEILRIAYTLISHEHRERWQDYTEDVFFGVVWRWRYSSYVGITDFRQFCPNPECDMELTIIPRTIRGTRNTVLYYTCEYCGKTDRLCEGSMNEIQDFISKVIKKNIRAIQNGKSISEILKTIEPIEEDQ